MARICSPPPNDAGSLGPGTLILTDKCRLPADAAAAGVAVAAAFAAAAAAVLLLQLQYVVDMRSCMRFHVSSAPLLEKIISDPG